MPPGQQWGRLLLQSGLVTASRAARPVLVSADPRLREALRPLRTDQLIARCAGRDCARQAADAAVRGEGEEGARPVAAVEGLAQRHLQQGRASAEPISAART
jgi:hypothetical protein